MRRAVTGVGVRLYDSGTGLTRCGDQVRERRSAVSGAVDTALVPPFSTLTSPGNDAPPSQVLELAERISTFVESGLWTHTHFPPVEEMAVRLHSSTDTVRPALTLLVRRGVLVRQREPGHHSRVERALPPPPRGQIPVLGGAVERAVAAIEARIVDGTWAGEAFPTIPQMKAELRFGPNTLCQALKLLAERGVVHKVKLLREGKRGRDIVWRPVAVASEEPGDVGARLEADIRAGRLSGVLLPVSAMASFERVSYRLISETYKRCQRLGLVRQVWLPDLSGTVWQVVDETVQPWWPPAALSKGQAIAHLLVRRMPEWLIRRGASGWLRRPLPAKEELRREYRTHTSSVEEAVKLLIEHGMAERPSQFGGPLLPIVPLRRQWCPVPFPPPVPGHPGSGWLPAGEPRQWRPLPLAPDFPDPAGKVNVPAQTPTSPDPGLPGAGAPVGRRPGRERRQLLGPEGPRS